MDDSIKADWLGEPALQAVFDALEQEGDGARVVGGAVRNTLLGVAVSDIDIATTAEPATVIRRVEAAGLKAVPTGVDHGTVTVVSGGRPFEVTTLREDVETHGRHATVRFGRNWQHDAARRDFTMNALYAARDGTLFDPVGGLPDLAARRVRFIGEADRRIREDYLRILRFFRFHAQYGEGAPDAEGLAAVARLKDGLAGLSAERIGAEMRKLVGARGAVATLEAMLDAGIMPLVLVPHGGLAPFKALRALDTLRANTREPALARVYPLARGNRRIPGLPAQPPCRRTGGAGGNRCGFDRSELAAQPEGKAQAGATRRCGLDAHDRSGKTLQE